MPACMAGKIDILFMQAVRHIHARNACADGLRLLQAAAAARCTYGTLERLWPPPATRSAVLQSVDLRPTLGVLGMLAA